MPHPDKHPDGDIELTDRGRAQQATCHTCGRQTPAISFYGWRWICDRCYERVTGVDMPPPEPEDP